MKTIIYITFLFIAIDCIPAAGNMHPAYDLIKLRSDVDGEEWKPRGVAGMDWLPDGRMILVTWGGTISLNGNGEDCQRGRLWLLEGLMDATGPEDVTVTEVEILGGQYQSEQECAIGGLLREPLGLRYVNGTVYLLEKPRLTRVIDATGTGSYEQVNLETLSTGWSFIDTPQKWHHFAYGLAYRDGYFYFNTGHHPPREDGPDRGACLKVSLQDGSHSAFSGGLRNANGIGLGPAGEIFATDNQGNWVPSCKLMNLRQDRFYGVHKPDGHFESEPETPPAVWMVHKEIGQSTTEPLWLKTGPYAGHMLVGDQKFAGLTRIFLERIDGEFQGCGFQFAKPGGPGQEGSFEAGTNRLLQGADGSFSQVFIGGVGGGSVGGLGGSGSTWSWNGTWYGFEKIVENGNSAFEMYAVRSLADGFEIEFTKPASDAAANPSNYTIVRGGFQPSIDYGAGNMLNMREVTAQGAELSPDFKKVTITVAPDDLKHDADMLASTVFKITLSDNITVRNGTEKAWSASAWYTLNKIGPADILGCMDPDDANYNAAAEWDDGLQCAAPAGVKPGMKQPGKARIDGRVLTVSGSGTYCVTVSDYRGRTMLSENGKGTGRHDFTGRLKPGMYVVRISFRDNDITGIMAVLK